MTSEAPRRPFLAGIASGDIVAAAAIGLICVAFFWRLVFTDLILPRGDAFTYFYPYWAYRNAVMASGYIPLWNPFLFMGVPFLANSQAGVLYPLNWPLIWLDAPTAIKAAAVIHIVLAACGAYVFARRTLRISMIAASLTGLTFALGGYVTSQVEHVNQLQGLAWLPWAFLLLDETAARSHRVRTTLLLGIVLAFQVLAGHAQTVFITIVGLGLWSVWAMHGAWLTVRRAHRTLNWHELPEISQRLLALIAAGLIGVALAAAQILPTLELTARSNRSGGLPFIEALSFSLRPYLLGRSMLPQYSSPSLFSEYVGYLGIVGLILAMAGAWQSRRNWTHLGMTVIAVGGLFLALGAYNPAYWLLVRLVPGFQLFRAPARWLALWAFGAAGLTGLGLEHYLADSTPLQRMRWHQLPGMALSIVFLIALTYLAPLAGNEVDGATRPSTIELALWGVTTLMCLGVLYALPLTAPRIRSQLVTSLAALSVVELFLASLVLPFNRLTVPAAWDSQRPAISTLLASTQGDIPPGRFLSLSDTRFDPGDLREIQTNYEAYLNQDQIYDYIVATKDKEILAPNLPLYWRIPAMDGYDGGILPTRDYVRFTSLFVNAAAVSPDGRLRENLKTVPDLTWLRLTNVQWIITDKVNDAWIAGIYYDLQFAERCVPDANGFAPSAIEAYPAAPFEATEVGIVGHIEADHRLAPGTRIGTVAAFPLGASTPQEAILSPIVVSEDGSSALEAQDHTPPIAAGNFTPDNPSVTEYRTLFPWFGPRTIDHVEVTVDPSFQGTVVIRGITLIDGRTGAFSALTISKNHVLRLANSGDVKVYQYQAALPRAYLVCRPEIAANEEAMWAAMRNIAPDTTAVIADSSPGRMDCDTAHPGDSQITAYNPERIVVRVTVPADGTYLVLSDAWYPGWEATVDGQVTPILHANGLFRAVRLPQGAHSVTFTYRSRLFELGAAISGLALAGVIVTLITVSRREPRS